MHDAFQNRRLFLNQDFFYRETAKRRRWRDFFVVKRLLSVDIELIERRLLNIFEIYRVQNRFRASYVRNFIFFDYFDFALKWSDRMIVFTINTFFLSIDILLIKSLCDSTHAEHRRSYRQILSMWSYRWQLKHCLIRQLLTNSSQDICEYSCKRSSLMKQLICSTLWIFTINDDYSFFSLMTLFDQIILAIRKLECKISFCFSMRRIIFC
jgi:hypothetical protein